MVTEKPVFVARQAELARLDGFLDRALNGQGQICFVAGEPGAGKTALVDEFGRRAQSRQEDLVVVTGTCDAQTGAGDSYLPFREVLDLLVGNVEDTLAQGRTTDENARRLAKLLKVSGEALVRLGPDLIGLFVPVVPLLANVGKFAAEKSGWAEKLKKRIDREPDLDFAGAESLDQGQIFEQYINVLRALAKKTPIALVLEDLQWADDASLALLFRLGRRLEGSRILVVGTYRPSEVGLNRASVRHPLEPVVTEMKRYFGDITLDLNRAWASQGREFVDAYLDTQFNCLDESFRETLFRHTGGHPLFTVELLQHMREGGALVQDEHGCWNEAPELRWVDLPSRVEGVIEERIGRLSDELREGLSVASVEGERFTAEVVAQVESREVRSLVRQLSGQLQKGHQLVESQGVERLGLQRLSRYRFSHNLVQTYLYGMLDEVELSYLHEDVGNALEALYGDQADGLAVQLARHFELAGMPDKARYYLQCAGEQAAAGYANAQAAEYFSRALALTPETDLNVRYGLLLAREQVYDLQGAREAQGQDLEALEKLVGGLDAAGKQTEITLRQSQLALNLANYPASIRAAEQAIGWAEAAGNAAMEAAGHRLWGEALRDQGAYEAAREQYELARELAQLAGASHLWARSLHGLGSVSSYLGEHTAARSYWEQARTIYQDKDDLRGEGLCLRSLAIDASKLGEHGTARTLTEEALRLAHRVGDRLAESRCLNMLGNVAADQGDLSGAQQYYEQALGMYRPLGNRASEGAGLMNLGYVLWELGDFSTARSHFEEALEIGQEANNRRVETFCLENLGMVACDLGQYDQARVYLQRGLDLSQELGLRDVEGSVLNELGVVAAQSGDVQQAQAAFSRSLDLHRELGYLQHIAQAQAGLAQASLDMGDVEQAQAHVIELLAYLETDPGLAGAQRPFRVHLVCYRVLQAAADERAGAVLDRAHSLLQARAAMIPSEATRHSFLQNRPVHREILLEYVRVGKDG